MNITNNLQSAQMFVIPSICANFKTTIMKRLFYLTIIILSVFASCKDDVETPKYSLDENGDVVVANDNKALRTTDLFNSVVCGRCWKITNAEFLTKTEEHDGFAIDSHFFFEKESCTIYINRDYDPSMLKVKLRTNYDETSGKLTNEYNHVTLTLISINADHTITAFKKGYDNDPTILTLSPLSKEEYDKLESWTKQCMNDYLKELKEYNKLSQ